MKNKKVLVTIIITILISILISFLGELVLFNRKAITHKRYSEKLKVIKSKGFDIKNNEFISNKENAYIILDGPKKYINKLSFDYQTDYDFILKYKVSAPYMEKRKSNKISRVINTTTRKINMEEVEQVKLVFSNKDVRIKNIVASNKITISYSRLLFLFAMTYTIMTVIVFFPYFKNNIEKAFLLIGLSFGALIIILTPVCLVTSSDDQVHFHRFFTLLGGKYTKWTYAERYFNNLEIDNYKKYQTDEEIELYKQFLNKNHTKKSIIKVENLDSNIDYQDLIYLPFSIGYKIARIFNFSFVNCIYFSKLCNLLVYLFLMYYAIKIIPIAKKLLFFIGLLPTNIYLASQFSYDATITAGILISFATFLYIRKKQKVDFKNLMIFVLGITWASLPKMVYCPMLLLIFFIPNKWFDSKKQAIIVKIGTFLMFLTLMSTIMLPILTTNVAGDSRIANTSVSGQLKYILSTPVNYLKLLVKETVYNFDRMAFGMNTFSFLGYLSKYKEDFFNLSNFIILATIFFLTFTDHSDKKVIDKKIKVILSIILLGIWCLIWSALYLSWTPVGENQILGVQSRYFLPIIFPFLVLFIPYSKRIIDKKVLYYIYIIPILIISYSAFFIIIELYR